MEETRLTQLMHWEGISVLRERSLTASAPEETIHQLLKSDMFTLLSDVVA